MFGIGPNSERCYHVCKQYASNSFLNNLQSIFIGECMYSEKKEMEVAVKRNFVENELFK